MFYFSAKKTQWQWWLYWYE